MLACICFILEAGGRGGIHISLWTYLLMGYDRRVILVVFKGLRTKSGTDSIAKWRLAVKGGVSFL